MHSMAKYENFCGQCMLHKCYYCLWITVVKLSDLSKVKLMRFEDPLLGPRRIPVLGKEEEGKLAISDSSVFHISLEKSTVQMSDNGLKMDIGDTLIYLVQWDLGLQLLLYLQVDSFLLSRKRVLHQLRWKLI